MPVTVKCPGCGSTLQAGDELAGKKVRCQKCKTVIDVPAAAAPAATPEPASPAVPDVPADLFPPREAVTEAAPAAAPPPRRRDEDAPDRPRRPDRPVKATSSGGVWLIVGLLAGALLLGSCCVGGIVVAFLAVGVRERRVEVEPPVAKQFFPPPIPQVGPGPNAEKDGPGPRPPGPNGGAAPPAEAGPPVPVVLDAKGAGEGKGFLDPNQKDPQAQFRPRQRFRIDAKADTPYLVEVKDPNMRQAELRVEPADGGPAIEAKGKPGWPDTKNEMVFFADKARAYIVSVTGSFIGANGPFTLRVRVWDESQPLPDHLKIPPPDAAVPRVEVALNIPNKLLTGGAFAPDGKTFWTAANDSLILWEQPFEKRGSYKLGKSLLHSLAVDGQGRLYAQTMPTNPAIVTLARPVVGPIEIYEGLNPKGDAEPLPAPTKKIDLRGIVKRLVSSPDGRWVYFLDTHNRKVGRIDTQAGTVDQTNDKISTGTSSFCLTPDGKKLYCCSDTNRIDVLDAATLQLEKAVTLSAGQPVDIAATDKGVVFLLGRGQGPGQDFLDQGNLLVADLSRVTGDKATVMRVRSGHRSAFLQMAPDQKTVFASGDRRVSACVVPSRPAIFQVPVRDYSVRDFFTPGWIQISPDGRTILHDLAAILSVSR